MEFPFARLCLNGGGTRGILQVGALVKIESMQQKPLHELFYKGMHGVSIGAMICSFLAFGFTGPECIWLLETFLNLQSALSPIRLNSLMNIPRKKGLDDGTTLHDNIALAFKKKNLDLDTLRIGDALCPLGIYAVDLTKLKAVKFGPNVKLWDALRASTAIPIVYTPHTIQGRIFVDGGIFVDEFISILHPSKLKSTLHLYCTRENGIIDHEKMTFIDFTMYVMNSKYTQEHHRQIKDHEGTVVLLKNNDLQVLDYRKVNENRKELLQFGEDAITAFFRDRVPKIETSATPTDPQVPGTHIVSDSSPA